MKPDSDAETLRLVMSQELERNKLDLRLPNGDFGTPGKAEIAYSKRQFVVRWLTDDGKVNRFLGKTIAIIANGLALVECSRETAARLVPTRDWWSAPYFEDSVGNTTFLFSGGGVTAKRQTIADFIVTAYMPCSLDFEQSQGRYLIAPPSHGLRWIREPGRRDTLPRIPAAILSSLKGQS